MTKPTKWPVLPAKTQISLGIRPVWSVFTVRMNKAWVPIYPLSSQRRLWSDWADDPADLSRSQPRLWSDWADDQADLSRPQRRLWSDWADDQADLSAGRTSFCWFCHAVAQLIWSITNVAIEEKQLSHRMKKPTKYLCNQRRLRSAWASTQSDQSSLCTLWVAKDPILLHADSEDSDQPVRMPRLIWVLAGCKSFCWSSGGSTDTGIPGEKPVKPP